MHILPLCGGSHWCVYTQRCQAKAIEIRPLGSCHPEHKDMHYPVNYGYVEGIIAPDGEEQDVYILGVYEAVEKFTRKVIAIIF